MKTKSVLITFFIFLASCTLENKTYSIEDSPAKTAEKPKVLVHGHRGARYRFPENTLPAMKYALESGVDVLEFDLGVTKDGVVVVNHNIDIDPAICLNEKGEHFNPEKLVTVNSLTLEEIKKIDCGTLQNPKFPEQTPVPGTRIPTLDEVFTWIESSDLPNAKTVQFNIETKIEPERPNDTVGPEEFVEKALAVINQHGMKDRVIIQSFDFRTLDIVKKIDSTIRTSALTDQNQNLVEVAKEHKVDFVAPYWKQLKEEDVKNLHAINVQVAPWTANTPDQWDYLISIGVDAIITDDPQTLIHYIR